MTPATGAHAARRGRAGKCRRATARSRRTSRTPICSSRSRATGRRWCCCPVPADGLPARAGDLARGGARGRPRTLAVGAGAASRRVGNEASSRPTATIINTFQLAAPDGSGVGARLEADPAVFEAFVTHVIDTGLGRIVVGICYENQRVPAAAVRGAGRRPRADAALRALADAQQPRHEFFQGRDLRRERLRTIPEVVRGGARGAGGDGEQERPVAQPDPDDPARDAGPDVPGLSKVVARTVACSRRSKTRRGSSSPTSRSIPRAVAPRRSPPATGRGRYRARPRCCA